MVPLEAFDQIELNSSFDVELVEDSVFYVEVIGHHKTVEKMSLVVEKDVLKIDNLLKNKFVKPKTKNIVLVIHSKSLKMVMIGRMITYLKRRTIWIKFLISL